MKAGFLYKKEYFGLNALHPFAAFCLLLAPAIFSAVCFNPYSLGISLTAVIICGALSCPRSIIKVFLVSLPLSLFTAVITPLTNHRGRTLLFELFGRPVTLQAVKYGILAAATLISVTLWFCVFNKIISTRKITFLFAGIAPSFTMLLTMTLRMFPLFVRRFREILLADRYLNQQKSRFSRLFGYGRTVSILISWSLEDAVDTADSMRARGYGADPKTKRTSVISYHFTVRDAVLIILFFVAFVLVITGCINGAFDCDILARRELITSPDGENIIYYTAFAVLNFLPVTAALL